MDITRLQEIEARWLAARSGPWAVRNTTAQDSQQVRTIRSFADAVKLGICRDIAGYVHFLESVLHAAPDYELDGQILYGATPKAMDRTDVPASPLFRALDGARPGDVEFVAHASSDVGWMIVELRRCWKRILELEQAQSR